VATAQLEPAADTRYLSSMTDNSTGAMQQWGNPARPDAGRPSAGLVLLYAEGHSRLPAAWPIVDSPSVIGREAPAQIVIPVGAVSRKHAEIVYERHGFTLRDLGSTNGTLLDGRLIREARLEHGQELRVGDAILKFVDQDIAAYERFRLDGELAVAATNQPTAGDVTDPDEQFVGGFQLQRIASEVQRIARSPLSVMLLGESGTGKEIVARAIHQQSGKSGAFCAVNCAAIPGNLLESELFGYKRGAFSGADRDKPGLIRTAEGGTLLLDEIGDMPLAAQAKLLRVLQAREVFPLGAIRPEPVDVRVICATHRDLRRMQDENRFREDLFARLNEYQLRLPPLRDRKEDIYVLFRTFLARHGNPKLEPTFRFMTALLHYDWPYNVRELEACAKRCIALAQSPSLDVEHLPDPVREEMTDYGAWAVGAAAEGAQRALPEEEELRAALARHQGNVAAVGRELGKARMQVHRWLKRYDISLDDYR
jgi:DNA-binding NtrC family response regulator